MLTTAIRTLQDEHEEGFTLIELLVVILIIGILASIAIPAFLNQRKSAVDSTVQSDISTASMVIESWMVSRPMAVVPTLSVNNASEGTTALGDIFVSEGTTLTITGSLTQPGAYTIKGTNAGGDVASEGEGFVYNSLTGGFQSQP